MRSPSPPLANTTVLRKATAARPGCVIVSSTRSSARISALRWPVRVSAGRGRRVDDEAVQRGGEPAVGACEVSELVREHGREVIAFQAGRARASGCCPHTAASGCGSVEHEPARAAHATASACDGAGARARRGRRRARARTVRVRRGSAATTSPPPNGVISATSDQAVGISASSASPRRRRSSGL